MAYRFGFHPDDLSSGSSSAHRQGERDPAMDGGQRRRMRPARLLVASVASALIILAGACSDPEAGSDGDRSTSSSSGSATGAPEPGAEAEVGRFASDNPGSVNTFWLHAPDGLIVIDSGRNVAGGRRAVAEMQATGEPVVAIVVTHPHPDHIGGLGVMHEAFPEARIYASDSTRTWMQTDPLGFLPLARQADPDFPAELTQPDATIYPDTTLRLGGLELETEEFGSAESGTHTAIYEPTSGALFPGDLTADRVTPALLEGHSCGWLVELEALDRRFPDADSVYPGHGAPGKADDQVDEMRTYLKTFRRVVRSAVEPSSPEGPVATADEQASAVAELEGEFPGYPRVASVPNLQELNVDAVAKELAGEAPSTLPEACQD